MYEDLIRELRCCPDAEYGCSRCKHKESFHCRETLMRESADAIEKLKEELADKPKWISVKEKLPEDGKYVLAYSADDDFMTVEARHHFNTFQITHWMPLPEPPKEDNDGN